MGAVSPGSAQSHSTGGRATPSWSGRLLRATPGALGGMAGCRHVVGIQPRFTEEVEGPQPWMPCTCSPPERWDGRGQAVSPAGPEVSLQASVGISLAFSLLTEPQPSRGAKGGAGDPGAQAGAAGGPAWAGSLVSSWEPSGPEGMAEPQRRSAEAGAWPCMCGSAVPGEGDPGTGPLCPFALKMRKPVHAQEELGLRARSFSVLAGAAYKVEHRCCAKPSPTPRAREPQLQHKAALCFPPQPRLTPLGRPHT